MKKNSKDIEHCTVWREKPFLTTTAFHLSSGEQPGVSGYTGMMEMDWAKGGVLGVLP